MSLEEISKLLKNISLETPLKIVSDLMNQPNQARFFCYFDLQTRYSVFVVEGVPSALTAPEFSTDMRFSPYTDSPGHKFFVTNMSSLPRATKIPGWRWGSTMVLQYQS